MLDTLTKLFENNVVSEELRKEIEEAWQAKVIENQQSFDDPINVCFSTTRGCLFSLRFQHPLSTMEGNNWRNGLSFLCSRVFPELLALLQRCRLLRSKSCHGRCKQIRTALHVQATPPARHRAEAILVPPQAPPQEQTGLRQRHWQ